MKTFPGIGVQRWDDCREEPNPLTPRKTLFLLAKRRGREKGTRLRLGVRWPLDGQQRPLSVISGFRRFLDYKRFFFPKNWGAQRW